MLIGHKLMLVAMMANMQLAKSEEVCRSILNNKKTSNVWSYQARYLFREVINNLMSF